jgi:hypothetical protein
MLTLNYYSELQSLKSSAQSSFMSKQTPTTAPTVYSSDDVKSQFPLTIRSLILFHQEIYQLISLFKSNYTPPLPVKVNDNDSVSSANTTSITSDNGFNNVKPNMESNSSNNGGKITPKKKKAGNAKRIFQDTNVAHGYQDLCHHFPQLDNKAEEFVQYLTQQELKLSLVYQFHVFAQVQAERTRSMSKLPTVGPTAAQVLPLPSTASTATPSGGHSTTPTIADSNEPILRFHIVYLDAKRVQLLANNDIRYATIVLQRMFRGYIGRKRFQYVFRKRKEINRRRWLAWKVLDKLNMMRANHERMAIRIQSNLKGWLWRKTLRIMNINILKIQCAFRILCAKKRLAEERRRRIGGPEVINMLPTGRVVVVHGRRLRMSVHRCGNNFKFRGFDIVNGEIFYGSIHKDDLLLILNSYNTAIAEKYVCRGELPTCLHCKQEQVFPWQYEKITELIIRHLDLVHGIHKITNEFVLVPGEESDKQDCRNDLSLIVSLTPSPAIFDKLQTKFIKHEIADHPYLPFLKTIIHEDGQAMRLPGNSKNRKNLIRNYNASTQRRVKTTKLQSKSSLTTATSSNPTVTGNSLSSV